MLFCELLQIALGHSMEFSRVPSKEEWRELFLLAKKQALIGVSYVAIEKLPKNQKPPRKLYLQWGVTAEHIVKQNEELNIKAISISKMFREAGFRNVVLKGQGVALYYGIENLNKYRMPGDVDIWLDGSRGDIVSYVCKCKPDCKIVYHHIDFPEVEGVEVEVHFTPSWMNSYFTNRVLQRYFDQNKEWQFAQCEDEVEAIPVPSLAFNRVYILVHIYRHLFHEGIGLRQLMDYYFVLRQGFTATERDYTMRILRSLKMERFTSAVMWVLQEVLGLEDVYLLTSPNEKEGNFLLKEIIHSGNFGKSDKSLMRSRNESDLSYAIRKLRRNFRFIRSYPSEVLWSPLFKVWHYFWRNRMMKTKAA